MQEKNVVPGRTWTSLRERYLKFLRKKIRERAEIYSLDADQLKALLCLGSYAAGYGNR